MLGNSFDNGKTVHISLAELIWLAEGQIEKLAEEYPDAEYFIVTKDTITRQTETRIREFCNKPIEGETVNP